MKPLIFIFIISTSTLSYAKDIFIWTDENGVKHYSEAPPENNINKDNIKTKQIKETHNSKIKPKTTERPRTDTSNDKATLRNINGYYDHRVKQCKQTFKTGSKLLSNCIQEQEEIKKEKMNKYINK